MWEAWRCREDRAGLQVCRIPGLASRSQTPRQRPAGAVRGMECEKLLQPVTRVPGLGAGPRALGPGPRAPGPQAQAPSPKPQAPSPRPGPKAPGLGPGARAKLYLWGPGPSRPPTKINKNK